MNWQWNDNTSIDCIVFYRVNEELGGLSNMFNDFPLCVNGVPIGSSEALYQACRYPRHADWQKEIINAPMPCGQKCQQRKTVVARTPDLTGKKFA